MPSTTLARNYAPHCPWYPTRLKTSALDFLRLLIVLTVTVAKRIRDLVGWAVHVRSHIPGRNIRPEGRPNCWIVRAASRGSGEASGIYISLPSAPARHPLPQLRAFPMSSPTSSALQQLYRLNRSSSEFHDQVSNILYGEEYQRCVQDLQGDDLEWVVDYLDKVRRRVALPRFPPDEF